MKEPSSKRAFNDLTESLVTFIVRELTNVIGGPTRTSANQNVSLDRATGGAMFA